MTTEKRLKHIAAINSKVLPDETPPDREFLYIDIATVGRGRLVGEPTLMNFEDAPSRARRLVSAGDTIVSMVRTYLRAVWPVEAPTEDLVVSTGFAVVTPQGDLDPRFFAWFAQSDPFIEEIVARSVGVSYPAIRPEEIGNVSVPIYPVARQRAIADFLDDETARIDALIAKKRRMIELLEERAQAQLFALAGDWRGRSPTVTLRQAGTRAVTGPFGTQLSASEYVSGGTPVVNPTHIVAGRLEPEEQVTVDPEVGTRLRRHQLQPGDLVLGRKGDVGRSALARQEHAGWICGSDSIAVRCDPTRLNSEFLSGLLSIEYYRQQLQATSTGAMVASVNEAVLLSFRIPLLGLLGQKIAASRFREIWRHRNRLYQGLNRQIDLLQEHRQALITAAVAGELEIPSAA